MINFKSIGVCKACPVVIVEVPFVSNFVNVAHMLLKNFFDAWSDVKECTLSVDSARVFDKTRSSMIAGKDASKLGEALFMPEEERLFCSQYLNSLLKQCQCFYKTSNSLFTQFL